MHQPLLALVGNATLRKTLQLMYLPLLALVGNATFKKHPVVLYLIARYRYTSFKKHPVADVPTFVSQGW